MDYLLISIRTGAHGWSSGCARLWLRRLPTSGLRRHPSSPAVEPPTHLLTAVAEVLCRLLPCLWWLRRWAAPPMGCTAAVAAQATYDVAPSPPAVAGYAAALAPAANALRPCPLLYAL
jgi:hypothetical protein